MVLILFIFTLSFSISISATPQNTLLNKESENKKILYGNSISTYFFISVLFVYCCMFFIVLISLNSFFDQLLFILYIPFFQIFRDPQVEDHWAKGI